MFNPEIKYDFTHLETGLASFVCDLELKLQNAIEKLPVFVLQTGDFSYRLNKKFTEVDKQEVYVKTPRFIISFDDIQYLQEQNSNQYNKFVYHYRGRNYLAEGRRIAVNVPVNTNFVVPNFMYYLKCFELMSCITAKPNLFTYEFLGNTYDSAYSLSSNSSEKPSMDIGSNSRNMVIINQFDLQFHMFVPILSTIELLSESGFTETEFNFNIIDTGVETEEDYDDLNLENKSAGVYFAVTK